MARVLEDLLIKAGLPTVEEAVVRLQRELQEARRRGVRVLRVIHGYGSCGKGGRLRTALRRWLEDEQAARAVGRVVPGESWEIFDPTSLGLLEDYPELRADADLGRQNAGITLVETRRKRG